MNASKLYCWTKLYLYEYLANLADIVRLHKREKKSYLCVKMRWKCHSYFATEDITLGTFFF